MKRTKSARTRAREASDAELLAALLGPVTPASIHQAQALLDAVGGYPAVSGVPVTQLTVAEGIGQASAYRLKAAVEIGRRALIRPLDRAAPITCARQVAEHVGPQLADAQVEFFYGLFLDTKHRPLDLVRLSMGCLDSTVVHPRECFRPAVQLGAAAAIYLHDHPSADVTPSAEDRAITRRLVACGELLGIEVLDSIILGRGDFYSFREAGDL